MWKASHHTDDENLRWALLRAIEWDAWPFFVSQPIVPGLLYVFAWWKILVALAVIQFVWTVFVRTKFINLWLSDSAVLFTQLKWAVCPIAAYQLYSRNQIGVAALALLWPLALHVVKYVLWMLMAIASVPLKIELSQIGVIQERFMNKLGYRRTEGYGS